MDAVITAAARALAAGDPLAALNQVALRSDAPALALRGIAMAQLGDLPRARVLMREAAQLFGSRHPLSRARCLVAGAEIALATRDLAGLRALSSAKTALESHGDYANAAYAGYLEARHHLLLGRLDEAERSLALLDPAKLAAAARAAYELVLAGIAMRRLRTEAARRALDNASHAAVQSGIPPLITEVENATLLMNLPAARLITRGTENLLRLEEVEDLLASDALIVDACCYTLRDGDTSLSLSSRPVVFALLYVLARAWPGDVSREALIADTFRTRHADESHRARLRVEIGRLRAALRPFANIHATKRGFKLTLGRSRDVMILDRPLQEKHATVLALLADGELWSSSAMALALGCSQRSIQRALESLMAEDKVQALGHGRARRWTGPPVPGITTTLLLPYWLAED